MDVVVERTHREYQQQISRLVATNAELYAVVKVLEQRVEELEAEVAALT